MGFWMNGDGRRWSRAVVVAMLSICAACTLLVDRSALQCRLDSECVRFGGHPFCQNGVCVASGLGPSACFYGKPQQPQDFLNQCSDAECLAFDNCKRLGLCSGAFTASLIAPPFAAAMTTQSSSAPGDAAAAAVLPRCFDPATGRSQVVYINGSSNFPLLLSALAPLVQANGYTPVFQITSSCTGVKSVYGSQQSDQFITDPAPGSSVKGAAYFKADGSAVSCALGPNGAKVDIGESDIFATTCGYDPPGGSVGEYLGPIQAMAFVVPGKSGQTAITAEAARAVFGMGGDNGTAMPWINPELYFVRNSGTGTQQMIGLAIGVPANAFWGVDRGTAANVDSLMRVISDATAAEEAIGIISTDFYDGDRANLKALAFKASGQECAYLPDSTEFKMDKRNVRDGHYPIWGPLHFFTTITNGVPSPAAQAFVSVASVPNIPKRLLDAFIASSLVPDCAMKVQRSTELGELSSYLPPFVCGCYFDASVNGSPPSDCTPCNTANDCVDPARPACNLGYCEIR
jgi:ABC-type phosphate transport system substrate-binding protein